MNASTLIHSTRKPFALKTLEGVYLQHLEKSTWIENSWSLIYIQADYLVFRYLTTGVQAMNQSAPSYTLIQPIGTKWRQYEEKLGF